MEIELLAVFMVLSIISPNHLFQHRKLLCWELSHLSSCIGSSLLTAQPEPLPKDILSKKIWC